MPFINAIIKKTEIRNQNSGVRRNIRISPYYLLSCKRERGRPQGGGEGIDTEAIKSEKK